MRPYAFPEVMSGVVTAHLYNVVYSINFDNQIPILTDYICLGFFFILSPFGKCMHFHSIITDKVQLYNFNNVVMVEQTIK